MYSNIEVRILFVHCFRLTARQTKFQCAPSVHNDFKTQALNRVKTKNADILFFLRHYIYP